MIRLVTGLVLAGLLIGIVWGLPWWATTAAAALVAWLAGRELAGLARHVGAPVSAGFVATAAAVVTVAFAVQPMVMDGVLTGPRQELLPAVLFATVFASGALALMTGPPSPATITAAGVMLMAPLYVGLPLGALAWARSTLGPEALGWLVAVIAVSDSAQYYTGRAFGRRKLAPHISPAKTVEGAMGGLVAVAAAGAALGGWGIAATPVVAGGLAFFLAAAGMVGDLFESLLKRAAGVKDSSHLIPGHGGVLDRVDSYLLAAPIFYLFLISR